jgi:hypothetical protein
MTHEGKILAKVAICYNSSRGQQLDHGTIRRPRESKGQGSPTMQTGLRQPIANADDHLRAQAADEERELALLAQFMRHNSVVSLANAIAERFGGRMGGADLIAAAGLDRGRSDN